ncbi:MAG: hypothetical protein J6T01_04025, partial [Kiritimatiellae bacterium]|nr:hypothetical protein [Kiritimatiellia bacterium]
ALRLRGDGHGPDVPLLARRAAVASIPNIRAAGASPYRCERGLSADQTAIDARDFGKGRIVALDWMRPPWSLTWKGSYESRFPAMRNAIDWAAGVTHKCDIRFAADAASEDLPADANFIAFEAAAPDGATVKVRVRNAWNDIVLRREWRVAPGKTMLSIPVGDLPGGGYHTDVIAETRGSNAAVYQHPFTKAGVALTIAGTNETIVAENRAASLPVSWNRNLPFDCELRAELRDRPYGQVRRVWRQPAPKNRTWVAVGIPGEPFPTLSGEIIARLVSTNDNRLVAEERKLVYFPNSRQDIYPSISWDTAGSGGMPELFAPQLVEKFGYRNNLGGSQGKQCAWFNARNVPYSCRVGIWAAKGGCNWPQIPVPAGKKRNEVLEELGYDCSPYNPAARKAIEEGYTPVVKHSAPYGVCVWSFGDECGYGNDLGIGSKTDARDYGAFLKAKYGTLERYNRAHGTSIDSFEKAEHATVKDAIDRRDWPLWFDNVQYSEKMYADMYEFLQSIVKKYDPKGRCGAEGSVPGDLELTVKNLKFWGPYRSLVNDEVLRNIAPDHVRAIWWGGYLARSLRDGYPVQQWEFLVTGTVNADEWYTITPGGTESAFGGDYDLAPYAKQYLPHLSKLRRGQAQVLVRTPMRQSPFALYYSHPSVRAASVEDAVISPEGGLADLIRFAYRYGYDTRMITPRTIKKLDGGVKVLFLAGSNALSDEEISVFKAFVKRGGVLVADSVPGVFDQFLAKRVSPPLEGAYEKFENFRDAAKLAELLARNKIAPVESVSGLPADAVILRVREVGGMKVVGLKTHTMHRMNAVTLDFGGESHVYEVDEGPVGKVRKVEMKPMGVPFRLFSVFTEEQKPPAFAFEGGRDSIAPGDFLEYGTGKLRKGSIYRLEVLDPDMKPIDCREEIFAADARPRRLQFPFSDRPGSYTVVLRDIATGLDAAVQVKVNPAVCSVAEGGAK